ncbi:50S ribosomal protein L6 [Acuticoccus sediminis]|uniref:Large ribosomal subunit protein uL6 n=1 Tax=Acuticoccus sediminis TaxID=2184697 RepID=A0A8B2P260_9HYPH|nr:50S ribosomal protein L6 [Acuticoccus sediminis]RAI04226.1 50S ribosomal protein L6 [Acuticoccus sediminis]
MSRIGKLAIAIPKGVTANVDGQKVSVKGPKGTLEFTVPDRVAVKTLEDGSIKVDPVDQEQKSRAMWGLSRTMIQNLVTGVTDGFTKNLQINGVGYRAAIQGKDLELSLGFSHPVKYAIPEGIDIKCPKPTEITVSGIDKQRVGQVAAEIRKWRPPEPYKGKGVKYADETIVRKEGKKK